MGNSGCDPVFAPVVGHGGARPGGGHGCAPIALDAMGGDHAPGALVAGALRAAEEDGLDVVLVGRPDEITRELRAAGADGRLAVVAAPEVVGMGEDPALALRAKPGASIRVAAALVAQGRAAALVSAGSTGATLAAALLSIGRLPGVRRPAVAAAMPIAVIGEEAVRHVVLLDAGASADVQAEILASYARMGAAYVRVLGVMGRSRTRGTFEPRVGLLNMASEAGKGNELARAAYSLLAGVPGFVGNVEPEAVLAGAVDVVVTDGFTGNVFLKTVEALRPAREDLVRARGSDSLPLPGRPWPDAAAGVLLGVAGEVLVAHGAARAEEVRAALRAADRAVQARLSRAVAGLLTAESPVASHDRRRRAVAGAASTRSQHE